MAFDTTTIRAPNFIRPTPSTIGARLEFLDWVRQRFPLVWERSIAQMPPLDASDLLAGFNDPGDPNFVGPPVPVDAAANTTWYMSLLNQLNTGFGQYIDYRNSRDIFQMNLMRAAKGLVPLTQEQVSPPAGTAQPVNLSQYLVPAAIIGAVLFIAAKA